MGKCGGQNNDPKTSRFQSLEPVNLVLHQWDLIKGLVMGRFLGLTAGNTGTRVRVRDVSTEAGVRLEDGGRATTGQCVAPRPAQAGKQTFPELPEDPRPWTALDSDFHTVMLLFCFKPLGLRN